MGANIFKRIAIIFLMFIVSIACSSDDDSPSNDSTKSDIENIVKDQTWIVSQYLDDNEDETHHYNGYEFTFFSDGTLRATNGPNTYMGTWRVTDDDDNSQSSYDFVIFFSGPEDFEELSDDWDIISYNSNTIQLFDVSGGDGTTDYLTFTKL